MKLVIKLSILLLGLLVTAVFMMSSTPTQVVLAAFTSTPTSPPPATDTPVPPPTDTPVPSSTETPVPPTATSSSNTGSPSQPSDPNPTPTPQGTAMPTPEAIPALGDGPGIAQVSMIGAILFGIFVLLVIAWWKAWQTYKQ